MQSVADESDMKDGQGESDVPVVSSTVCQFALAGSTRRDFVRHTEPRIETATTSGGARWHAEEFPRAYLELGYSLNLGWRQQSELQMRDFLRSYAVLDELLP